MQSSPEGKANTIRALQEMQYSHVGIEATDVTLIRSEPTAVVNVT